MRYKCEYMKVYENTSVCIKCGKEFTYRTIQNQGLWRNTCSDCLTKHAKGYRRAQEKALEHAGYFTDTTAMLVVDCLEGINRRSKMTAKETADMLQADSRDVENFVEYIKNNGVYDQYMRMFSIKHKEVDGSLNFLAVDPSERVHTASRKVRQG